MLMLTGNQAALLMLAVIIGTPTAVVYYDRRGRYRKHVRAWRRRMTAMADQPFHLRLLSDNERLYLIGRHGQTSDEWVSAWAADMVAGRCDHQPTCGEYLRGFGRHPHVRIAEDQSAEQAASSSAVRR